MKQAWWFVFGRTTIAKKSFTYLRRVNGKRMMIGGVRRKPTAVFIAVLTLHLSNEIPYTPVAVVLFVKRNYILTISTKNYGVM